MPNVLHRSTPATGNCPAIREQTRRVAERTVRVLTGRGPTDFDFCSGKPVVWLAADKALAEAALADVLAFYHWPYLEERMHG